MSAAGVWGRRADALPVRRVRWRQACRIVPTRYPSVYLFDRVADAEDFDALYALEALTNDRIRDETGVLQLVPPQERIFGPGSGPIMAAFTHINPAGSRFADGALWRVLRRARARDRDRRDGVTTTHGSSRPPTKGRCTCRCGCTTWPSTRGCTTCARADAVPAAVFDADDYDASRALGRALHERGSAGVVYRSVRHAKGQCVGLFKPRGAKACLHAAVLLYAWDGSRFSDVFEKVGA